MCSSTFVFLYVSRFGLVIRASFAVRQVRHRTDKINEKGRNFECRRFCLIPSSFGPPRNSALASAGGVHNKAAGSRTAAGSVSRVIHDEPLLLFLGFSTWATYTTCGPAHWTLNQPFNFGHRWHARKGSWISLHLRVLPLGPLTTTPPPHPGVVIPLPPFGIWTRDRSCWDALRTMYLSNTTLDDRMSGGSVHPPTL